MYGNFIFNWIKIIVKHKPKIELILSCVFKVSKSEPLYKLKIFSEWQCRGLLTIAITMMTTQTSTQRYRPQIETAIKHSVLLSSLCYDNVYACYYCVFIDNDNTWSINLFSRLLFVIFFFRFVICYSNEIKKKQNEPTKYWWTLSTLHVHLKKTIHAQKPIIVFMALASTLATYCI